MEIYAENGGTCDANKLVHEHPLFYNILVDITNDENLTGVEIFRENQGEMFTAKMKTHGYGIVLTTDKPTNKKHGYIYVIAKLLSDNSNDITTIAEGPLTWDTLYQIKDNLISLFIIK